MTDAADHHVDRRSLQSFAVPPAQPSVIDCSSGKGHSKQALPGLRCLREDVRRDCESPRDTAALSTNASHPIAVWGELVHARQPVAVYRMFSLAGVQDNAGKKQGKKAPKAPPRTVKVDVVAENGARWVRVNMIKNSRLMMELLEVDSYLTGDEDEDESRPRLAQTEFDNSMLRMGRDLLAAAKANPLSAPRPFPTLTLDSNPTTLVPGSDTMIPQVTIRLTRLNPLEGADPRIEQTIQCLRDMGIDVQLGERSVPHPTTILGTPTKPKLLEPTVNVNLDLSALVALISDISHSPLPRTEEQAHARFVPPQSYLDWKKERTKLLVHQGRAVNAPRYGVEDIKGDECTWEGSGQHSRSLAAQAIQEMAKGILGEIHACLSAVVMDPSTPSSRVAFWTTNEARHRCLQIVSKIGGRKEKQRADALLSSTLCGRRPPVPASVDTDGTCGTIPEMHDMKGKTSADMYWEHSRYPAKFLPLTPVCIYSSILPAIDDGVLRSRTSFFDALTRTCTEILSCEATSLSQDLACSESAQGVLEEIPAATQTSLSKLTIHTVKSMLAGASRGHTTLTTNRSSVKAVLKETRKVCGDVGCESRTGGVEKAALWVLDPRSLSEGMRSE